MTLLGAIIAGGEARRFGTDKASARLKGVALIDHVARALGSQTDALVVVGREWGELPTVPDRPHGGEGPLGGLNAALHFAREQGHEAVLCAGCDTLPVPPDMAARLSPGPAVVEGHWLMGYWPATLAVELDRWLASQDDRSIRGWMRACGARMVAVDAAFYNINTPEALAQAEAALSGFAQSR